MTDYQRSVNELRSFCQSSDQTASDDMRAAAAAYREASLAVNARLRRCEEFLSKGLRSEAIQLAEAEPPLLDALAILDFPEWAQWDQLAGVYGLAAPQRLLTQTAEALNRAYAEDQPLKRLLREHRQLALARAPIRERLILLRKLSRADAGNPVWMDDLRTFEAVRVGELNQEIDAVLGRNDPAGIAAAWTELTEGEWASGPPMPQINRLRGMFAHQVAAELRDAVAGGHAERALRLRDKWQRLQPGEALAAEDPLWNQVKRDLKWLGRYEDRQQREMAFHAALGHLELALAEHAPPDELREHWAAVQDFDMPVPAAIEGLYHDSIAEVVRRRSSRELMIVAATFAVGALALVAFLVWALLIRRR